jgi:hypothetical protein
VSIHSFRVGMLVVWMPDGDQGTVVRVIPEQAVCIRWGDDPRQDTWYSAYSGSLSNIEVDEDNEESEAA